MRGRPTRCARYSPKQTIGLPSLFRNERKKALPTWGGKVSVSASFSAQPPRNHFFLPNQFRLFPASIRAVANVRGPHTKGWRARRLHCGRPYDGKIEPRRVRSHFWNGWLVYHGRANGHLPEARPLRPRRRKGWGGCPRKRLRVRPWQGRCPKCWRGELWSMRAGRRDAWRAGLMRSHGSWKAWVRDA